MYCPENATYPCILFSVMKQFNRCAVDFSYLADFNNVAFKHIYHSPNKSNFILSLPATRHPPPPKKPSRSLVLFFLRNIVKYRHEGI